MNPVNLSSLLNSFAIIGKSENLREEVISLCRKIEKELSLPNRSIRNEITGPIIDALHKDVGVLKKRLQSGVIFEFMYSSIISRDFIMSPDVEPDHVWEPQTTKLLVHLSTHAKHVVIGGAYFGDHAILVAQKLAQSHGLCHAFEPNKKQLNALKRNSEINKLTNIMFNEVGLWENDFTLLKLVGDDSHAHPEIDKEMSLKSFPTITIDTYGSQHDISSIDLIMLDIEGAELSALKGSSHYLSLAKDKAPKIVFEIHRNYVDWSNGLENTEIVNLLTEFGYYVFAIRDFQSNFPMDSHPIELIPLERTYLEGPPHGFNMLAVKNLDIIENDFFKLCYDVSPKLLLHKDPNLHYPT